MKVPRHETSSEPLSVSATARTAGLDLLERGRETRQQRPARFGEDEPVLRPGKQRHAQRILEVANLPADCAVGDAELAGGAGHAAVPRCRLECAQGIQGREGSHVRKPHIVRPMISIFPQIGRPHKEGWSAHLNQNLTGQARLVAGGWRWLDGALRRLMLRRLMRELGPDRVRAAGFKAGRVEPENESAQV